MSQENVTAENSFNIHSGHSDPLTPYHGPGTIIGAGKRAESLPDKLQSTEEDGECMGVISGSDECPEETGVMVMGEGAVGMGGSGGQAGLSQEVSPGRCISAKGERALQR